MIEIEAKIKLKNREEFLSKIGNLRQRSKDHIIDIYFDKNNELASTDNVLRLRKQNNKAYIAQKGPRTKDCNLLVREENETEVSSFDITKRIIESLGFSPTQITEKTREAFVIENCDTKIELDRYPFIGYYLEIEGIREDVLNVMRKLGYEMNDAIAKNCTELFYEYIEKEGIELDNPHLQFTFRDEENILIPGV